MKSPDSNFRLNRRELLKGLAALEALSLLAPAVRGQTPVAGSAASRDRLLRYLEAHRRADGGYAFADQLRSHLTPTFAVIGCHRLLGATIPNAAVLSKFVRGHHPRELKKLDQPHRVFDYQQVQALSWLGADAGELRAPLEKVTAPLAYNVYYEKDGNPVMQSEAGLVKAHALLGLPIDALRPAFLPYFLERRRSNGSFNNTPAADGSDGHVMNTWWSLEALALLSPAEKPPTKTTDWLQRCQKADGGFTYQPDAPYAGVSDVAYTRAAVRGLRSLGAAPADPASVVTWLLSLANDDGGFGDQPGWLSNPMATYCALDALEGLGALDVIAQVRPRPKRRPAGLPQDLSIFSLQIEAHGTGSPVEAVRVASAAKIDLWGVKNATAAWMARARQAAKDQQAAVQFFTSNEEGTLITVPGLGTYSHVSDLVAPAGANIGAAIPHDTPCPWSQYRERRWKALDGAGGCLVWQFNENEEITRILLDDSLARGGYAAISTFHFYNPDFTNSEPFLQRWRGQIPYVALQDAHGYESWWAIELLTGSRTLFLAHEPTWASFRTALRNNWVAAVRHDDVSRGETWVHAGSDDVAQFIREREAAWRWWDQPSRPRPLVSLVAIRPEDEFEAGRPDKGVALRVRCAWKCTLQNTPDQPLADLVSLTLDGKSIAPELIKRPRPKNPALGDVYYLYNLPTLSAGSHTATAVAREIKSEREESVTVSFTS